MSRGQALALIGAILLLATVLILAWVGNGDDAAQEEVAPVALGATVRSGAAHQIVLFFPSEAGFLVPESRSLPQDSTGEELAATVITHLLSGPQTRQLFAPLPEGVALSSVHLSQDGILYVDLSTADGDPLRLGSQQELLATYSLVDSIIANVEEAHRVVLLWNGQQRETFAGNVDTRRPLAANRRLVQAGA